MLGLLGIAVDDQDARAPQAVDQRNRRVVIERRVLEARDASSDLGELLVGQPILEGEAVLPLVHLPARLADAWQLGAIAEHLQDSLVVVVRIDDDFDRERLCLADLGRDRDLGDLDLGFFARRQGHRPQRDAAALARPRGRRRQWRCRRRGARLGGRSPAGPHRRPPRWRPRGSVPIRASSPAITSQRIPPVRADGPGGHGEVQKRRSARRRSRERRIEIIAGRGRGLLADAQASVDGEDDERLEYRAAQGETGEDQDQAARRSQRGLPARPSSGRRAGAPVRAGTTRRAKAARPDPTTRLDRSGPSPIAKVRASSNPDSPATAGLANPAPLVAKPLEHERGQCQEDESIPGGNRTNTGNRPDGGRLEARGGPEVALAGNRQVAGDLHLRAAVRARQPRATLRAGPEGPPPARPAPSGSRCDLPAGDQRLRSRRTAGRSIMVPVATDS